MQAKADMLPQLKAEHEKWLRLAEKSVELSSKNMELSTDAMQLPLLKETHRRLKSEQAEVNRLTSEIQDMQVSSSSSTVHIVCRQHQQHWGSQAARGQQHSMSSFMPPSSVHM